MVLALAAGTSGSSVDSAWSRRRRGGRGGLARLLAASLAGAVLGAGLAVPASAAEPTASPAPTPASSPVVGVEQSLGLEGQLQPVAADELTALREARSRRERVEVLSRRTETSSTWANPDGSLSSRFGFGPLWVRRGGEGFKAADWAPVDLTLQAGPDGSVAAAAHPMGLRLSGARGAKADGELASVAGAGGASAAVLYDGALPVPALDGPRATYAAVLPGVDLVVEATRTGFEQYFVLRSRPAPGREPNLRLALRTSGVTPRTTEDGAVELVAGDGEAATVVGRVPRASVWDADVDAGRLHPVSAPLKTQPGEGAQVGPVLPVGAVSEQLAELGPLGPDTLPPSQAAPAKASPQTGAPADANSELALPAAALPGTSAHGTDARARAGLVRPVPALPVVADKTVRMDLRPEPSFLHDPRVRFPLVVDPEIRFERGFDTWVDTGYNSDQSGSTQLRVGRYTEGSLSGVARSWLNVDLASIRTAKVYSASLSLWNFHSWSCQAMEWQVSDADPASTATRWAAQPARRNVWGVSTQTTGYEAGGCGDGWVSADLTNLVQTHAYFSSGLIGLAVTASESDVLGWKKFNSANAASAVPSLYVNYVAPCSTYANGSGPSFWVCGAIRDRYTALGANSGHLGYPTTDELGTPDGKGRYNHFIGPAGNGTIMWTADTGAWEVYGAIRGRWEQLGWETGIGYPTTGETGTPDGRGRYNHFRKADGNIGSIYWTPTTGPWEVYGGIRAKWAAMGYESSCLGYPISGEYAVTGGRRSDFERGNITYNFAAGVATATCDVAPSAPASVTASASTATVSASWPQPASWGGANSASRSFVAELFTGAGSAVAGSRRTLCGTCTSTTFTGLPPSSDFRVKVTAVNTTASSPTVTSNLVRTPAVAPDAPRSVTATAAPKSAQVSWQAPASDGGSAVTGYTVTPVRADTSVAGSPVQVCGTCLSATVPNLTASAGFFFRVTATNSAGTGPAGVSNTINTPAAQVPEAPSQPDPAVGAVTAGAPAELSVLYRDPDGDAGTITVQLFAAGSTQPILTRLSSVTASGSRAQITAAELAGLLDGDYRWTAVAQDGDGVSTPADFTFTIRSRDANLGYDGRAGWAGSVHTGLGNFVHSGTDVVVATSGPELSLSRTYNSLTTRSGGFGPGWSHTLGVSLTAVAGGNAAIDWADGRREVHTRTTSGSFTAPTGVYARLETAGSGYRLTGKDRSVWTFTGTGQLTSVVDAAGRTLALAYSGGRLDTVTDVASSRFLDVDWTAAGDRIASVTTSPVSGTEPGLRWTYSYSSDAERRLTGVCTPRSTSSAPVCHAYRYTTTGTGGRQLLDQVTRPEGNAEITVGYVDKRVAWTQTGTGDRTTFAYPATDTVRITDPRGNATTQVHDSELRLTAETGPTNLTSRYGYDAAGNRQSVTDGANQTGTVKHDATGNPIEVTNPAGETTYAGYVDDLLRTSRDGRSASATDNRYLTEYGYDALRNRTSETTPATADSGRITRTWTFSTGTEPAVDGGTVPPGLQLTSTDGRSLTTTYRYDARGDLREQTDPTGLVTRWTYDGLGRQLTETVVDAAADPDSREATSTFTYDGHGNVKTETGPAVVNEVTGTGHQARTVHTWDGNDNLRRVQEQDATGGQPERSTTHLYDAADRQKSTTDPAGGLTSRTYDPAGNLHMVTDAEGRTYRLDYDSRNLLSTVTLLGFRDDPVAGSTPRDLVVARLTHDNAGRQETITDALGRTVRQTYDGADRPDLTTLLGYHDLDGAVRDVLLADVDYDRAGHATLSTTGGPRNPLTVRTDYDNAGWVTAVVTDPQALARTTTFTRDRNGNPTVETRTAPGSDSEQTRRVFDAGDRVVELMVENGAQDLTTLLGYDQRGNQTSTTDPRGTGPGTTTGDPSYTTTVSFDALSRPRRSAAPPVTVDDGDSDTAPSGTERPQTVTGYDTWGNPTHARDARGHVTVTAYDPLNRADTITHPGYTPPGGTALTPVENFDYDKVGNLIRQVSRRGQATDWVFDALNRAVRQSDPAADASSARPVTRTRYDDAGNVTSVTDPTGAVTQTSHDDRNRPRSTTQVVRDPDGTGPAIGGSFTTVTDYDDSGHLVLRRGATLYADRSDDPATAVDERYAVTRWTRNAAGEATETTDPTGAVTHARYDLAGRLTQTTDPLGRRTVTDYDLAGRATTVKRYADSTDGSLLTTSSTGYDPAGNPTALTSPRGHTAGADLARFTTIRVFDALNRLLQVTVPTSNDPTADLTTRYGYDAAGNHTRTVDGRGNHTRTRYQSWNLPAQVVEPATEAHNTDADRTWTFGYDAGGLAVTETQPGGVSLERDFDRLGRLVSEAGQGPDAPTASRTFGYDMAGRRTALSHPDGTIAVDYDDRGLLVGTTGPAGTSAFGYDSDGRMTTRTDAAGTSTFSWTVRDELRTATDSLSGQQRTWQRNPAGELQTLTSQDATSGAPGVLRTYTQDALGRLLTDTLQSAEGLAGAAGSVRARHAYTYDPDGNPTSQTVEFPTPLALDGLEDVANTPATVNAAEGRQAYCYDHAGRLARWDKALPTDPLVPDDSDDCGPADLVGDALDVTDYGYDAAGNRTSAGAQSWTYDQRNRLLTGPAGNYTHTARGTLTSSTDGPQARSYTFDALGRQTAAGTATFSYDALDRIASRSTGPATDSTATAQFGYAGAELDPVDDHTNDQIVDGVTVPLGGRYARSPAGRLLALEQNGASPQQTLLNRHGDLVALTTAGGTLTDTRLYDPYGQASADSSSGLTPATVGFQGDWTDPTTSQVWMGARWYQPANATFTRRDTYNGELTTPISLNRYTYAHNNPLANIDPDGRRVVATTDQREETPEDRALSLARAAGKSAAGQQAAYRASRDRQRMKDADVFVKRWLRQHFPSYGLIEREKADWAVRGDNNSAAQELLDIIEAAVYQHGETALSQADPIFYLEETVAAQLSGQAADNYGRILNTTRLQTHYAALGAEQAMRSALRRDEPISNLPAKVAFTAGAVVGAAAGCIYTGGTGCTTAVGAATGATAGAWSCTGSDSNAACLRKIGVGAAAGAVGGRAFGIGASSLTGAGGLALRGALSGVAGDLAGQLLAGGSVALQHTAASAAAGAALGPLGGRARTSSPAAEAGGSSGLMTGLRGRYRAARVGGADAGSIRLGGAEFSDDEIAQLTYQHIGAGDIAGRPSLDEISAALAKGRGVPIEGQNALTFEYGGVRVIVNGDKPWRSTAYYPGG